MAEYSNNCAVPDDVSGTVFYVPPQENLRKRSLLKKYMRDFFDQHDFLEVETPVRIAGPAPEEYIDCIAATGKFLRPSPELEMKVLLANGYEKIYQFGPCFRADEHGWKHREESQCWSIILPEAITWNSGISRPGSLPAR